MGQNSFCGAIYTVRGFKNQGTKPSPTEVGISCSLKGHKEMFLFSTNMALKFVVTKEAPMPL
jgi:hypothetical protein